jgi:HlyD family secretion protein
MSDVRGGERASRPPGRRTIWLIAALVVVGIAVAADVVVPRLAASRKVVPLVWVLPTPRQMAATVTTTGTVRLKTGAEVRVGAQVSGIVRRLNVSVGSRILAGDVIAEIDQRPIEARVAMARTQQAMDRVALEKAKRDVALSQQLLSARIIPPQQTADLEWQVKAAEAKLDNSTSALAAAEIDLAYAVVRSPMSGIVASVSTQEGETVAASFASPTFVTIVDDRALELVAMVDETDIANVKPGESAVFTVEADPSRELKAVVTRVDPTATIISGVVNYPVVASIRGLAPFLKPDMTANISITTAEYQALVVPAVAVHGDGNDRFVYVLKDGAPAKRDVTLGARDSEMTEITRGLAMSDRVLTSAPPRG